MFVFLALGKLSLGFRSSVFIVLVVKIYFTVLCLETASILNYMGFPKRYQAIIPPGVHSINTAFHFLELLIRLLLFQVCPAGYYCDNRLSPVVLFKNSSCPVGHYCPAGTKTAYENKCPRGTFSNQTGLENNTQCSPCPGGFYCPELGQTTFSSKCNAGTSFRIEDVSFNAYRAMQYM